MLNGAILLDHLLASPGIRLVRPHHHVESAHSESYELLRHRKVHATAPRLAGRAG
jgi:hypothetical protein